MAESKKITNAKGAIPKMGPEPVLLSRKEVDALYETLAVVVVALDKLGVDYIVTGGSLLGAVRQHSILFCDDDIDIAVIGPGAYNRVSTHLAELLGKDFVYSIKPWEGGDKVRPKRMSSVFLDIFCLRRFETIKELVDLIGVKKNGQAQPDDYVQGIVSTIETSVISQQEQTPLCPFWHFNTRKAVEMWSKEVYREHELFPLSNNLKMGPLTGIKGPKTPVLLLKRAFGMDCFEVYYQSGSHKVVKKGIVQPQNGDRDKSDLSPLVLDGGTWEGEKKVPLEDEHYLPMQPVARAKRRPTLHGREQLFQYIEEQSKNEEEWLRQQDEKLTNSNGNKKLEQRPDCTVYMDGVFDLFHIGHLEAIRQCAELGNRVIIGVTGDKDAADYKRPPIISERDRVAVVSALQYVDAVVCPCPLVVTEEFMAKQGIDLVVHGFANDADAERQREFFEIPMKSGRFKRISYYSGLSTTDIINKIRALPDTEEDA